MKYKQKIINPKVEKIGNPVVRFIDASGKVNWICKWFGHSFDLIELTMFKIKKTAINKDELNPKIECRRCKKVFK